MTAYGIRFLAVMVFTALAWTAAVAGAAPPDRPPALMLANHYRQGMALEPYWVSEKLDGVRAYWDGHALWTRAGNRIVAPVWFTKGWPPVPMDGELWGGRGHFQVTMATVRQQQPDEHAWRNIRYMIFDLPAQPGPFTARWQAMPALVARASSPWLQAVAQFRVGSHAALMQRLSAVEALGGEGLMLHRGDSLYRGGRSDDLLKVKRQEDAEARVVAHLPGQGKYRGLTGALLVETPAGLRFRLGSGLGDAERHNPPPLGSWVTYRFRGYHDSGIPRFASFLRVREGMAFERGAP